MQLIRDPRRFDVLVCGNMFGDILSDELAALCRLAGHVAVGEHQHRGFGLYEPAGGSAPDIAGRDIANPIAQILSAALMLRHSFRQQEAAAAMETAVEQVLASGLRTADMAGPSDKIVRTAAMGDAIAAAIAHGDT